MACELRPGTRISPPLVRPEKEEAMIGCSCGDPRRRSVCHLFVGGAMLMLAVARPAVAQFDRGTLSGTIKDEQGAVMPGVTVTAVNTQTKQSVTAVTDGTG